MKEIQHFYDAVNDLPAVAESIKRSDKKIIGYLCAFVPEELIIAAGFHPMRLFSSTCETPLADNHLQSYCCAPVKGLLEDSLSGLLNFLDGTVFPHACDTIARLSDIWRMNTSYVFFSDLAWPTKLDTKSAEDYVLNMLKAFIKELEEHSHRKIQDDDLSQAIQTCNQIRSDIQKLYKLKASNPDALSAKDLYTIIKGAMVMDKVKTAGLLQGLVQNLESIKPADQNGKRLIVSGAMCDVPGLIDPLEESGGFIVGDDFCTGRRWFERSISETGDPLKAIVKGYMNHISCPAKHQSLTHRKDHLIDLVNELNADGVVFLHAKFCDPHAFDYPYIRDSLEEQNIKSLMIETDATNTNFGQITTRIETFLEIL